MPRSPKKQAQIAALAEQPEKTELEYYIIAVNKSVEGHVEVLFSYRKGGI